MKQVVFRVLHSPFNCGELDIVRTGNPEDLSTQFLLPINTSGTRNAFLKIVAAKTKRNLPWWLESGSEICPACGHAYVYQTEYRCFACDGPLCPLCVEYTSEFEIFCPETECGPTHVER